MITNASANQVWLKTLTKLVHEADRKNIKVKGALSETSMACEILNHSVYMDMQYPRVTMVHRNLDLLYSKLEALMILSGANRLDFHPVIQRTLEKWSDDGIFIRHAYGPKVVDQIPYIMNCFQDDIHTRRAVINVWRDSPGPSKDTTCLVNLQLLMREEAISCIVNMRSSDAWLGMPNDLASYSYVVEGLRHMINAHTNNKFGRGYMHFNAGSRHLYVHQLPKVANLFRHDAETSGDDSLPDFMEYDDLCEWLAEIHHDSRY